MESRVSTSLKRSISETWSVCDRASVRTMKSKSAAVNRARQFALIIGTSSCAVNAPMASQRFSHRSKRICSKILPLAFRCCPCSGPAERWVTMKNKGNNHCDGCGGSVRALAASAGIQFGDLQTEAYRLREKLGPDHQKAYYEII